MRQPVCVGCDGRELLTLNSVTAPLTEPHLNAHKRSPKYLRNTRPFRGGRGVGASPGKQPRLSWPKTPRGERAKPKNLDNVTSAEGFPHLVPCQPSCATNAPSGGTPSHASERNGLMSSKFSASLCAKESFWCPHPAKALQAWEWVRGFSIRTFRGGCHRPAQQPRTAPARDLLPPDNLGHGLHRAKEAAKIGTSNKNLRVEAASMKSSEGYKSFFETVLICSGSDYAPFTCSGSDTKHRLWENRQAVAQAHCKHNPAAQLRAKQQNLQSLKYVCKGAILSVT